MSEKLIPLALSSQIDNDGAERLHAAPFDTSSRSERRMYISITGDMLDGFVGDASSGSYVVTGGSGSYTISLESGILPPGVTLNTDGTWSGTYQGSGGSDAFWDYTFVVLVTDDLGNTSTVSDSVRVTNFSINGDVTTGLTGEPSSGSYSNIHGYGTLTYSVSDGVFPAGLTLASDGTWSGNRTTVGLYNWTVQAVDEAGNIATVVDSAEIFDTDFWIREIGGIGNDSMVVVDGTTSAITTITAGDGQSLQIAMSHDFSTVYSPNDADKTLSVIDVATKSVASTESLAGLTNPRGIAVDADYIYITDVSSTNKKVRKYLRSDYSTLLTSAAMVQSLDECALTEDGTKLVVCNEGAGLYVFNTSDLSLITEVSLATVGLRVCIAGNTTAFVILAATGNYAQVDLSTYAVTTRNVGGTLNDICLSSDWATLYILKDAEVVRRNAVTGASAGANFPTLNANYGFALNASGTRLYISRNTTGQPVMILDLATGGTVSTAGLGNYGIATCSRPLP